MAKVNVTYVPGEGDPKQTTWRGKQFYKGQPVPLDDEVAADRALIAAAKGNPAFNVGDEDKAADRADAQKKNAQAAANMVIADVKEQGEAMKRRQQDEEEELVARHKSERDNFESMHKARYEQAKKVASGSTEDEPQGQEPAKDGDKEGRVEENPNSNSGQKATPVRTMSSPTPTTPQEATPAPVSPPPAPGQVSTAQPSAMQPAQAGQPGTNPQT